MSSYTELLLLLLLGSSPPPSSLSSSRSVHQQHRETFSASRRFFSASRCELKRIFMEVARVDSVVRRSASSFSLRSASACWFLSMTSRNESSAGGAAPAARASLRGELSMFRARGDLDCMLCAAAAAMGDWPGCMLCDGVAHHSLQLSAVVHDSQVDFGLYESAAAAI